MSVSKEKHEELAGKWSPIVAECDARDVGESIDVWCEKKGISKWKLYYWKRVLRNAAAGCSCDAGPEEHCIDITDVLTDQDSGHAGDIFPKYMLSDGEAATPHKYFPSTDHVPLVGYPGPVFQNNVKYMSQKPLIIAIFGKPVRKISIRPLFFKNIRSR